MCYRKTTHPLQLSYQTDLSKFRAAEDTRDKVEILINEQNVWIIFLIKKEIERRTKNFKNYQKGFHVENTYCSYSSFDKNMLIYVTGKIAKKSNRKYCSLTI